MLYSGPCIINVPVQCQVQSTQSNSVCTDTDGTIESVLINGVSVLRGLTLEKMYYRAFFSQAQSKLSIKMRCLY